MMRIFSVITCSILFAAFLLSCSSPVYNNSDTKFSHDASFNDRDVTSSEAWLNNDAGQSPNADYPDAEVLVKIITPSGSGYADSMGDTISLAGVVFGRVKSMYLVTPDHHKQDIKGAPYWQSDAVHLSPGDNVIEVHAQGEHQQAVDRIVVTYNPNIRFDGPPRLMPPALFVGEKVRMHATIRAPASSLIDRSMIRLELCDRHGKPVQDMGRMQDDGKAQVSGDEIQGDNVYTLQFNDTCKTPGIRYYRVAVDVKAFGGQAAYTAYSVPVPVECVNHLTTATCRSHQALLTSARKAYTDARASGLSPDRAKAAAYSVLSKGAHVAEHGDPASPLGIWVRFDDGVLGALRLPEQGIRGSAGGTPDNHASVVSALGLGRRVLSNRVLVWSPVNNELSEAGYQDEGRDLADMVKNKQCPAFDLDGPWTNKAAKLDRLRNFAEYGVIALIAHGDALFKGLSDKAMSEYGWFHHGSQEAIWSGQQVDCDRLLGKTTECTGDFQCPVGSKCLITSVTIEGKGNRLTTHKHGVCFDATQVDLMRGRLAMGADAYVVLPQFIAHYGQGGHALSLVYLGACRSMYNGSMAAACMASGAQSVVGYNGLVTDQFAGETGRAMFKSLLQSGDRVGVAASQGTYDPLFHSRLMLFGSHWLDLTAYSILNANFEEPGLLGWKREGDARVISRLGKTGPVEGKHMAIISTGLGFTTDSGGITQRFCLPPGTTRIRFFWKFYSEEFKEFCGSPFQDTFHVTLSSPLAGERDLVSVDIDSLCPQGIVPCKQSGGSSGSSTCKACTHCGSYWGDGRDHLQKSDVGFDKGGVWNTPWQMTTMDLSGSHFSSQTRPIPVTLKFMAGDTGDSIYDTAILIDSIQVE